MLPVAAGQVVRAILGRMSCVGFFGIHRSVYIPTSTGILTTSSVYAKLLSVAPVHNFQSQDLDCIPIAPGKLG